MVWASENTQNQLSRHQSSFRFEVEPKQQRKCDIPKFRGLLMRSITLCNNYITILQSKYALSAGHWDTTGAPGEVRTRRRDKRKAKKHHGTCHKCRAKGEILSFHKSKLKAVDFVKKFNSPSHEGVPREKKKITWGNGKLRFEMKHVLRSLWLLTESYNDLTLEVVPWRMKDATFELS